MTYYFDKLTERRGTSSYKWDNIPDGLLPLWVADMDFEVAPAITEALTRRAAHAIFGYTHVPQAYYDAVTGWFARRHNWLIESEWILPVTGVVPALSAVVKALTVPGDKVIVQTPVYNCFFTAITNNGCEVVENELVNVDGTYKMDFVGLERRCADPKVKVMVLCNPHNPTCRVWTAGELEQLNIICARHGVVVVSDEIHCELTYNGRYQPFAAVSDECRDNGIVLTSPSKSFNIAGLQCANVITKNRDVRQRISNVLAANEVAMLNPFGVEALIAAYNESEEWLDELCAYVKGNYDAMAAFVADRLPHLVLTPLEGTYLAWLDCRALAVSSAEISQRLIDEARVMINSGDMYGGNGDGFIRVNLACPRVRLVEALERMAPVLAV